MESDFMENKQCCMKMLTDHEALYRFIDYLPCHDYSDWQIDRHIIEPLNVL